MLPLHESALAAGKNIFRLTVILYLAFILKPGYEKKVQEISPPEHGIGGSILYEEIISSGDYALIPASASFEAAMLEQDSFFKHRILLNDFYTIQSGNNISSLAVIFGLNQDTIISVNKITNSRALQAGRVLKIPNQDGIFHLVRSGETLDSLAERYKADSEAIQIVNELFSDFVVTGTELFIPGARLAWERLQEINGDLFLWPVRGVITSFYGWRPNPFNRSVRQFHNGIDIRASTGTPVRAAMAGRVSAVGYDRVLGNYVIINHNSGYRTLYGHLSVIRTRTGAYVGAGERIGDVGNTGQSTGPHLHFTVYKNGVTVNPRTLLR
jgi:murein DD-endopeptidase MepM/ murein hydrolase activator NlpD